MSEVRQLLTLLAALVVLLFLAVTALFWIAGESHHEACVTKGNAEGRYVDQCSVLPWSDPGDFVRSGAR